MRNGASRSCEGSLRLMSRPFLGADGLDYETSLDFAGWSRHSKTYIEILFTSSSYSHECPILLKVVFVPDIHATTISNCIGTSLSPASVRSGTQRSFEKGPDIFHVHATSHSLFLVSYRRRLHPLHIVASVVGRTSNIRTPLKSSTGVGRPS